MEAKTDIRYSKVDLEVVSLSDEPSSQNHPLSYPSIPVPPQASNSNPAKSRPAAILDPIPGHSSVESAGNTNSNIVIQSDYSYNNGKDHKVKGQPVTAKKEILSSSLSNQIRKATANRKSAMVVHVISVVFVVAVGVAMKTGTSLFSWHPFFMSLGFAFFITQAILVFSTNSSLVASRTRQFKVKLHWIFHLCGVTCILIGFTIIYVNKEMYGKPHAKTWHGFLGFTSVFQFCSHCVGGVFLLYPAYLKKYFTLAQLKQLHATVGLLGFFLAATVVVLGLLSEAFVTVVTNDMLWFAYAAVPVVLALAIGNQVTAAYGPKKVKPNKTSR